MYTKKTRQPFQKQLAGLFRVKYSGCFSHQNPGGSMAASATTGKKNRTFHKSLRCFGVLLAFVDAANYDTFACLACHVMAPYDKMTTSIRRPYRPLLKWQLIKVVDFILPQNRMGAPPKKTLQTKSLQSKTSGR